MAMKPESAAPALEPVEVREKVWRVRLANPKGLIRVSAAKKHAQANTLFLEVNGARKFEIGNDCDTCHFWFKCLQEPKLFAQKKVVNLPKTISLPRPLDAALVRELAPMLDLLDKGEYYVFNTTVQPTGPYASDDESNYFHNNEFMEIWEVEDPAAEDLLSGWEHFEGKHPRIYRHEGLLEKQFEFLIPVIPNHKLKDEYIRLYQQMIANGDRPRILAFGLLQRPVPESVSSRAVKTMHSFFAAFILDGHHKLAAYRRAGVAANLLVILSQKASKYHLLRGEGADARAALEDRLASIAV